MCAMREVRRQRKKPEKGSQDKTAFTFAECVGRLSIRGLCSTSMPSVRYVRVARVIVGVVVGAEYALQERLFLRGARGGDRLCIDDVLRVWLRVDGCGHSVCRGGVL